MVTREKMLAYMASVVFVLPWIIMVTPCTFTLHVMLLVTAGLVVTAGLSQILAITMEKVLAIRIHSAPMPPRCYMQGARRRMRQLS